MNNRFFCALFGIALALVGTPAKASITYGFSFGGDAAAFGTITTDGHLGVLTGADIVGYSINLVPSGASYSYSYPSALSFVSIGGPALTATATGLYFDFSAASSYVFLNSSHGYFCLNGSGGNCDNHPSTMGYFIYPEQAPPSGVSEHTAFEGNVLIGTPVASAVPEPSTWAMMIIGFAALWFGSKRRRHRAELTAQSQTSSGKKEVSMRASSMAARAFCCAAAIVVCEPTYANVVVNSFGATSSALTTGGQSQINLTLGLVTDNNLAYPNNPAFVSGTVHIYSGAGQTGTYSVAPGSGPATFSLVATYGSSGSFLPSYDYAIVYSENYSVYGYQYTQYYQYISGYGSYSYSCGFFRTCYETYPIYSQGSYPVYGYNPTSGTFPSSGSGVGAAISVNDPPAAVGAVPEPSTWAMMIIGFCGLGFLVRRRRSLGEIGADDRATVLQGDPSAALPQI